MREVSHIYYEACEGRKEWPDSETRQLVVRAIRLAVREAVEDCKLVHEKAEEENTDFDSTLEFHFKKAGYL